MSQPFNKEQLAYLQQLITNRNKSLRHEVSDHLDNSLPVKKLENGAAGQVVSTDGNTTYWSDAIADIWASRAGNVVAHAGSTAPDGALLCYGQAVSRTTYSKLFAAIGTTYGSGDGVTTFNVPDLRGRVWAGLDNIGGSDAGRLSWANTIGTSGGSQINNHVHYAYGDGGDLRAAVGAVNGNPTLLGVNTLVAGNPSGLSGVLSAGYVVAGSNVGFSFWNHFTGVYGYTSYPNDANIMQPTILGNYIIWTGERP